jgi:hypothetical protein
MLKNKEKMNFIEWHDHHYVDDDDPDMKLETFPKIVIDILETCKKDYSEAYYYMASIFEEYLKYLNKL